MNINKFLKDRLDKIIEKIDSVEENLKEKEKDNSDNKKKKVKK
jgi:hypothetical protein